MKTTIKISGQISGNFYLNRKLSNYSESKKGMFNSVYLHYDSKREAQDDLHEAWKRMREEHYPERISGSKYTSKGGRVYKITYDASQAEIIED